MLSAETFILLTIGTEGFSFMKLHLEPNLENRNYQGRFVYFALQFVNLPRWTVSFVTCKHSTGEKDCKPTWWSCSGRRYCYRGKLGVNLGNCKLCFFFFSLLIFLFFICSTLVKAKFMISAYSDKFILIVLSTRWIWGSHCHSVLLLDDLSSG